MGSSGAHGSLALRCTEHEALRIEQTDAPGSLLSTQVRSGELLGPEAGQHPGQDGSGQDSETEEWPEAQPAQGHCYQGQEGGHGQVESGHAPPHNVTHQRDPINCKIKLRNVIEELQGSTHSDRASVLGGENLGVRN